jgi:signal transduction histidine kinase
MRNRLKKVWWALIGTHEAFTLEHRILNGTLFMLILFLIATNVNNFVLRLGAGAIGLPFVVLVTICGMYYLARSKGHYTIPVYGLLTMFVGGTYAIWFPNGGISGSMPIGLVWVSIFGSALLERWLKVLFILVVISALFIVIGLEYNNPHWVIAYSSRESEFVDIIFGITSAIVTIAIYFGIFKSQYRQERERVLERTEELVSTQEKIAELNSDLQAKAVALEETNKKLEAFAYSVSHDLRAPLRHIDGFLKLLQKKMPETSDEKSQHYMEVISDSTKQMNDLIEGMLSFSRMGRKKLAKTQVDLNSLVQEIIRQSESETKGRIFNWHISDMPVVSADHTLISAALTNLISNAIKFTRSRKQAEIEIGCREQEEEIVFYIRDNGAGFDQQYAAKLFDVFQRLHRAEDFEGIGLGLANVRRIIEMHKGRTWAKGTIDQGAEFYFTLPTFK